MITKCISNYEVLYLMLDKGRFKKIRSNVGPMQTRPPDVERRAVRTPSLSCLPTTPSDRNSKILRDLSKVSPKFESTEMSNPQNITFIFS